MKILITGGGGFIGTRLARALLARGSLNGVPIGTLVLADQVAPQPDLAADARVQARVGLLLSQCDGFAADRFDGVFHLASAVSGECEADVARRGRRPTGAPRLLELGRRVRARPVGAVAVPGHRHDAAGAEDVLRHAQARLRTPDRRLGGNFLRERGG